MLKIFFKEILLISNTIETKDFNVLIDDKTVFGQAMIKTRNV